MPGLVLAKGPGRIELVAIAAILMATVALSIDIMLPALGEMGRDLGIADNNKRQWIITALFLGLTGGQLFFGPLSDSVVSGRWVPRSRQLDCVKFHGSSWSRRLCGWPLASAVRVALR